MLPFHSVYPVMAAVSVKVIYPYNSRTQRCRSDDISGKTDGFGQTVAGRPETPVASGTGDQPDPEHPRPCPIHSRQPGESADGRARPEPTLRPDGPDPERSAHDRRNDGVATGVATIANRTDRAVIQWRRSAYRNSGTGDAAIATRLPVSRPSAPGSPKIPPSDPGETAQTPR